MLQIKPVYAINEMTTNKIQTINKIKKKLLEQKHTIEEIPNKLIRDADVNINKIKALDDVDMFDLKSFTTINKDKTKTVHVFNEPIKFYDKKDKKIKFIDSTLKKSKHEKYIYENTAGEYKIFIPDKITDYVQIKDGNNNFIKFKPDVKSYSKANKRNITFLGQTEEGVEYKDVYFRGCSLQYISNNNSIKENILLKNKIEKNRFDFIIETSELVPVCKQGKTINFISASKNDSNKNENVVFSLGELFIRDSYCGNPDGRDHISIDNYYEIKKKVILSIN